MLKITLIAAFLCASVTSAAILPRQGQFITGACANDAACTSGCCNASTGKCAARLVAEENSGPGCGFGGGAAAPAAGGAAAAAPAAAPAAGGAAGSQFITGACANDAACASGCCNASTGKCAARLVAEENSGPGCGFGGGAAKAAKAPARRSARRSPAMLPRQGQFITGTCANDAACTSGCCNASTGKCAARLVAEENGGPGCGFGGGAAAPAAGGAAAAAAPAAGGAAGSQFITGPCANDAACASGCCNASTGKCAARLVAEENSGPGCGFGGGAAKAAKTPARRSNSRRSTTNRLF